MLEQKPIRICLNCNTEIPDTPCPYCKQTVFKLLQIVHPMTCDHINFTCRNCFKKKL